MALFCKVGLRSSPALDTIPNAAIQLSTKIFSALRLLNWERRMVFRDLSSSGARSARQFEGLFIDGSARREPGRYQVHLSENWKCF